MPVPFTIFTSRNMTAEIKRWKLHKYAGPWCGDGTGTPWEQRISDESESVRPYWRKCMQGHLYNARNDDGDNRKCLDRDGFPMEAEAIMELDRA
jgi:hypothetical protein